MLPKDAKTFNNKYNSCLLQLISVQSETQPGIGINLLRDGVTTIRIITFAKARNINVSSEPTKLLVIKVGGKRETKEWVYGIT